MNITERKNFIHEHSDLFCYIPEDLKENVSDEVLVETILNYGDLDAVKQLFELLGLKRLQRYFLKQLI